MGNKMMYIPNDVTQIIPYIGYHQWLKCFDTLLNESTNQNSIKFLKVVKPTNKKKLFLNFGDQCNKQPNVPSLLDYYPCYHERTANSDRERERGDNGLFITLVPTVL